MLLRDAVVEGVAFMDATRPNWRDEVDWDCLDMCSGSFCVLGQTLGWTETVYCDGKDLDWARDHGFFIHDDEFDTYDYNYLTELWLAYQPLKVSA